MEVLYISDLRFLYGYRQIFTTALNFSALYFGNFSVIKILGKTGQRCIIDILKNFLALCPRVTSPFFQMQTPGYSFKFGQ